MKANAEVGSVQKPAIKPLALQQGPGRQDDLWMVVAIVQPFRLDAVTRALEELPAFGGMTVSECRGFGHGKTAAELDRPSRSVDGGAADVPDFTPKVRLEIAVAGAERTERVVRTVVRAAHTGRRGDGKVFVWPLARAVRVRTFDVDARAL